jgi:hypothetical protein
MTGYVTQMREQRRRDRWADAQIRQAENDAAAHRQREERAENDRRAQQRKEQRRLARAVWFRRLPNHGMAALWATMIVLPISLAWQAQALFAFETLRIPAPWNHGFPAAVECAAWLCAFEAHRRIRQGLSAGLLPTYMWVLAGTAAAINGAHGLRDGGTVAGLALAVLSLLGVFLHSIRQGLDAAQVSGTGHARLALWRRVRYPRLSIAAASLRAARDGLTPTEAWELAWVDRFGVGPNASRRERRLARLAVRRAARDDRRAVRAGDVMIVDGRVQKGFARAVREHVDRERAAALAEAYAIQQGAADALAAAGLLFGPDGFGPGFGPDGTGANSAVEQGVKPLSPRGTELLPALQDAIRNGVVQPNPGVKTIEKWVRNDLRETLGTPVAMELRDRVRGLHAVPKTDAAVGGAL